MPRTISLSTTTLIFSFILLTIGQSGYCQAPSNLDPADLQKCLLKGAALDKKVKYQEAIQILSTAVEAFPDNAKAHYLRGLSYLHAGDCPHAIEDLNQAISLNKEYQDAYYIRGIAYMESNQYDKALDDFHWVTTHDPVHKHAYLKKEKIYKTLENADSRVKWPRILRSRGHDSHGWATILSGWATQH